jgi:hypothetical protein
MEGQTPQQGPGRPYDRPARPRHARCRSQGQLDCLDNNHYDTDVDHMCHGQGNGRVLRAPSHLRASSYTAYEPSSSRVAWDGRVSVSANHTPSHSPPQSPVLRSIRPRPLSAISLPNHSTGRPTVLADRWSYDRERMPSPPPGSHGSRPGTPMSEHEAFETTFSRPASTFTESRPSSRPQSILLSGPTDPSYPHTTSTPTLRVIPPPPDSDRGSQRLSEHSHRHSYHLLTSEEMEMLSRPPLAQRPMSATPLESPSPSPGSSTPNNSGEPSHLDPKHKDERHARPENNDEGMKEAKPGCCGLCELSTAKLISGKFGAWFVGTAIHATFGAMVGCIVALTVGCR